MKKPRRRRLAPVLSVFVLLLSAACSVAAAATLPAHKDYTRVSYKGWSMTVPTAWDTYRADGFDSPFAVFISTPAGEPARPDVSIFVSRIPRIEPPGDLSFDSFELRDDPSACWQCTEVRVRTEVVLVGSRWGVLAEDQRSDGLVRWTLVVDDDCNLYVANARASADRVTDSAETVTSILSSATIAGKTHIHSKC